MKRRKVIVLFGGVLIVLLGNVRMLTAQTATGEITGTVTDASGAVVPDAKVTATNQLTNAMWETKTTGTGVYSVPAASRGLIYHCGREDRV